MQTLIAITIFQILTSCGVRKDATFSEDKCISAYDSVIKKNVYSYVDKMPEYPGGIDSLLKYVITNLKYPKEERFQASFNLEFIIDANGILITPRIKNKNDVDLTEAEKELLKVMHKMPKWIAGECDGKKVPVKTFLPLKF